MMRNIPPVRVPWPAPQRNELPVLPVFLPFFGCPSRCIFCAQHTQTGQGVLPLSFLLAQARERLSARRARGLGPVELAFFGGTFTAVPEEHQRACLAVASAGLRDGSVASLRCSTRPDSLSDAALERLCAAGGSTVELGVQSFDDTALRAARRGYSGATALRACAHLRTHGLHCGVQLMPGMPGVTPAIFLDDVRRALDAGAACLRFYPCLVLRGTELEQLYNAGGYTPWPLETTLETLAQGWLLARDARVPVIRMGLAPEAGLEQAIAAGPSHPALGAEVQALALLARVRQALRHAGGSRITALSVPRCAQGCFWGHGKRLTPAWAALGLPPARVRWTDQNFVEIQAE